MTTMILVAAIAGAVLTAIAKLLKDTMRADQMLDDYEAMRAKISELRRKNLQERINRL